MEKRYIRAAIVSALLCGFAIFMVISVSSSDTSQPKTTASNVTSVTPPPGGLQRPQAEVSVDLRDGYIGRLLIDGQSVPEDQIEKVVSLGQYTFRPGKGQVIESFVAGNHSAEVFYWPSDEPEPETPENYVWTFRVTS